jgi:hypothetical protein
VKKEATFRAPSAKVKNTVGAFDARCGDLLYEGGQIGKFSL